MVSEIVMQDGSIQWMMWHDLDTVVKVHLDAFKGFFLSFLGPVFLKEFYSAFIADRTGIALVAKGDDRLLGFIAGTVCPSHFYRNLLRKNWWRFLLASIDPFLLKPSILPRLLRAFYKPFESTANESFAELMSLAVLPECQGKGIGQALVQAFLQESSRRGVQKVNLTTDRLNNENVNRFYQKLGFTCARTFTTSEGRQMNEYSISL